VTVKDSRAGLVAVVLSLWCSVTPARHGWGAEQAAREGERDKDAAGRAAVGMVCTQCHDLKPVTLERRTAEQWRTTVYDMISRGAQADPDEIEPIVSYLAATFGPQKAASDTPRPSMDVKALPEGAGRPVLAERCAGCHDLGTALETSRTRGGWLETIGRMRELGAALSADEETTLVDYLATHFGSPE
jgi:hypothetical protein